MNKACFSNCKNEKEHSDKPCTCGGHNQKNHKKSKTHNGAKSRNNVRKSRKVKEEEKKKLLDEGGVEDVWGETLW